MDIQDIPSGFKLRCTLQGSRAVLTKIAWSPNGQILASGSNDHIVYLWDIQTQESLRMLEGHTRVVSSVAWSPDGQTLVSGSDDNTVKLWDIQSGKGLRTLRGHRRNVTSVAWSGDGRTLASGSDDETIRIWSAKSGRLLRTLTEHTDRVLSMVWSPDGQTLATASFDKTVRLWDTKSGELLKTLTGHTDHVLSVAWSPDGQTLASGSVDKTIRLWNSSTGQQTTVLEDHTDGVLSVSFSSDGLLLGSKSLDNTIRLWHCDTWKMVTIPSQWASWPYSGLAFHPTAPILATLGEGDRVIQIWDLDLNVLLRDGLAIPSVHYRNAKVVLVGDTGVGKSGLSLVLTGQSFKPTESTHGRHIWRFDYQETNPNSGPKETRETLLWDLAGQVGYRLIHQLHLSEVTLALVVFDARSETDPFAGVRHWDSALRLAQRLQGSSAPRIKKFLVSARTDRGGIAAGPARIQSLLRDLGFDSYYETSAKEGWHIEELSEAIRGAINWEALPKVTSSELFQNIRTFLLAEKESGRLLSMADDLYHAFLKLKNALIEAEGLRVQFDTCLGLVESRGLILRLSFGNLILLQPELLDAYASAMVNAAKEEPDGMGSISEEDVREGRFRMPEDERIKDKEQEKLLLIATVEGLLRREIVLREQGDNGAYLVFPSQFMRENIELPDPEGKAVTFGFEGPVLNIYTTLAVRLSHSGMFQAKGMWKNASTYLTRTDGTCGLIMHEVEEGRGELVLFFDAAASEEMRFHFEEYVHAHLRKRALPEGITRQRVFVCPECKTPLLDVAVKRRKELGFDWIECNVCDKHQRISLLDWGERLIAEPPSKVFEMNRTADTRRDLETAASTLQGKIATRDFDVFLCHNNHDKLTVKKIGEKLKERGILPWLDEWELPPGQPWSRLLEQQIGQIKSVAVFVGKEGIGPWQQKELEAFLHASMEQSKPVIPVLLEDVPKEFQLPVFLRGVTWVDFRVQDPDPVERLIWGITGKRNSTQ